MLFAPPDFYAQRFEFFLAFLGAETGAVVAINEKLFIVAATVQRGKRSASQRGGNRAVRFASREHHP